ncbi:MAG: 3-phosphoglycerate dehydrogenase [Acidobacteria bacterium]|nr:3-phosphoglycerate dehydrogenase [Acidobacteriota bacterium]
MSKKVLVATVKPFAPEAVEQIRKVLDAAGYELRLLESYSDAAELHQAVADVDALIIRSDKVTPAVLSAAGDLKIVVRAGAGYDNVNLEAATAKGIVVMNTPGQNSNAVAELAFGLMLNLARRHYTGKAGTELRGKKLGIHAYGNVGRCVATIAKGFGIICHAYDPYIDDSIMMKDGVIPVKTREDLYRICDYVSLHIPAVAETIRSIDYDLMSQMKKGAALINTARAEVIDEPSLLRIMESRSDWLYASDIAPECKDELMAKYPLRCFFTAKKMGAQTAEANINAGIAAAQQIVGFFERGDTTFQVN